MKCIHQLKKCLMSPDALYNPIALNVSRQIHLYAVRHLRYNVPYERKSEKI